MVLILIQLRRNLSRHWLSQADSQLAVLRLLVSTDTSIRRKPKISRNTRASSPSSLVLFSESFSTSPSPNAHLPTARAFSPLFSPPPRTLCSAPPSHRATSSSTRRCHFRCGRCIRKPWRHPRPYPGRRSEHAAGHSLRRARRRWPQAHRTGR